VDQTLTIQRGFTESQRQAAAEVLYDAFERKLTPLLGDRAHSVALLAASLQPGATLVAVEGDRVLGVAGLKYGGRTFMAPRFAGFVRIFGTLLAPVRLALFALLDAPMPKDKLLLETLAVHASARGKGIGSQLARATFDIARENGCRTVVLDVVDTNPDAYRLYLRLGFKPVSDHTLPILRPLMGFRRYTVMAYAAE
jgi:ribosomal protein S18 acetylase RimI-like enzyme